MNFLIEIRHIESGLAKAFHTMEDIAVFLADKVHEEWEGWRHLGELPTVPAPEVAAEPVAESQDGRSPLADALRSGLVTQEGDTLHFHRTEIAQTEVAVVDPAADAKPAADADTIGT